MYTLTTINNDSSYSSRNVNDKYLYNTISIPRHKTPQPFIKQMHSLRKKSKEQNAALFHNFHKTQLRNYYNLITKPKLEIENKLQPYQTINVNKQSSSTKQRVHTHIPPLSLKAPNYDKEQKKLLFIIKPKNPFLTFSNTPCKHRHRKQIIKTPQNSLTLRHDNSNTKMTTTISTDTINHQDYYQHFQIQKRTFCTALANCYNSISLNDSNSIDNFNMKVNALRSLYLTKYSLTNAYHAFKEDHKSQVDEIERKRYLFVKQYKLFKSYYDCLVLLVRKLQRECNFETKNRDDLYFRRMDLEMKIGDLKNKIDKKKNELIKYENYKAFLLMVKYHVKSIYDLPYEIYVKYGYNKKNNNNHKTKTINQRKANTLIRKNTFGNNSNNNNTNNNSNNWGRSNLTRKSTKMSINNSNNNISNTSNNMYSTGAKALLNKTLLRKSTHCGIKQSPNGINATIRYKYQINEYNLPIFDDIDEFLSEINNLEYNTFQKFISYNTHQHNNFQMKYSQSQTVSEYQSTYNQLEHNIEQTLVHLNDIKRTNINLLSKYKSIQYELSYGKRYNGLMKMICEKIALFFNVIKTEIEKIVTKSEYTVIMKELGNNDEVILNGKKVNKTMFMIRILEKVLIYYINENKLHKQMKYYANVNKKIHDMKRIRKNEELKAIKLQNEIDMKNSIIMKSQKIYIRQVKNAYNKGMLQLHLNKKKKMESNNQRRKHNNVNEKENEFYQFVTY